MAITISGNGITSANIADGTITTDDINASDVTNLKSGRKNLIINGAMQISQRGTSFANVTNGDTGYWVCDRWKIQEGGTAAAALTLTQETATPPNGFTNYYRVNVTTADTAVASDDRWTLKQSIEGYNAHSLKFGTADAESVSISFWVRSSITGTFGVGIVTDTTTTRTIFAEYTIDSANTWERKTVTFSGDTLSNTFQALHLSYCQLRFALMTGSGVTVGAANTWESINGWGTTGQTNLMATAGNTFDLTGVQLEVGDTATDFEHRSYGEELALCQRYYQIATGGTYFAGTTNGTTQIRFGIHLATSMRSSPTLNITGTTTMVGWASTLNGVSTTSQPTVMSYSSGAATLKAVCGGFSGFTDNKIATLVNTPNDLTLDAEL